MRHRIIVSISSKGKGGRVPQNKLKKLALRVLISLGWKEVEFGIVLVNDRTIQDLNLRYRQKDTPTDVLSFSMECPSLQVGEDRPPRLLGEVVISVETARRQSVKYRRTFYEELSGLLIHGILHLVGFDHEEDSEERRMKRKERELIKTCWVD